MALGVARSMPRSPCPGAAVQLRTRHPQGRQGVCGVGAAPLLLSPPVSLSPLPCCGFGLCRCSRLRLGPQGGLGLCGDPAAVVGICLMPSLIHKR